MVSAAGVASAAPSNPQVQDIESLQPVLAATVSSGTTSARFYAKHQGSSTWDLVNGDPASPSGGVVRFRLPAGLSIGESFTGR